MDNKYFDRLKELVEVELAQVRSDNLDQVCGLLGLIKIVSCFGNKTDYSEKFLDTLELIISKVNVPFKDLSDIQSKVVTLVLSILADMIEHGILEHRLTYQIMLKKYNLFKSFNIQDLIADHHLTKEYCRYLFLCRMELEDLELEERQINLLNVQKSEEDADALEVFKYINSIIMS